MVTAERIMRGEAREEPSAVQETETGLDTDPIGRIVVAARMPLTRFAFCLCMAVLMRASGCMTPRNPLSRSEGWKFMWDQDPSNLDPALVKDYQEYVTKLPRKESIQLSKTSYHFFERTNGQQQSGDRARLARTGRRPADQIERVRSKRHFWSCHPLGAIGGTPKAATGTVAIPISIIYFAPHPTPETETIPRARAVRASVFPSAQLCRDVQSRRPWSQRDRFSNRTDRA